MISRGKLLALGAIVLLMLGTGFFANAQSVSQLQQKEEAYKALLAQDQSNYQTVRSGVTKAMAKLGQLSYQLSEAKAAAGTEAQKVAISKAQLAKTEALLQNTTAQVSSTSQRLAATQALYRASQKKFRQTEARLAYERSLFSGQLRLVEEHGSVGYLAVMVGANSFADLISRVTMLGQIAAEAADEVQTIRAQAQAVQQDEKNLAADQAALAETQATLMARQNLENQARAVVQQEEAAASSAVTQAVSQARAIDQTYQQEQQEMQTLRSREAALTSDMASLRGQINQVASQVGSLLQAFSSGSLDRQQLYQAMLPVVSPVAARFGLSPALVIAVITEESGGNQSALSVTGAIGLMQLEPGTAASLGIDPYNTEQNVLGGCLYLSQMLQLFNGNLSLALAAYNAGPGAVQQNGDQVPSYTQGYVSNIEGLYSLYSSYGS